MSVPPMTTRPESGLSKPDNTYNKEVLPAPEGPTIAVNPALGISNETSLRITLGLEPSAETTRLTNPRA